MKTPHTKQQHTQQQPPPPKTRTFKFKWDKKTIKMKNPVCPTSWFQNVEKFLIQAAMSGISQSPKASPQKLTTAGGNSSRPLLPSSQTTATLPTAPAVATGQAQQMKTITLLAPSTMAPSASTSLANSQVQYRLITTPGDNKPVSVAQTVLSTVGGNSINRINAPTVRELLDSQRRDEPPISAAIAPARMSTRSSASKVGGKGVTIDLTEEEENSPKREGRVQGSPRQQVTMIQPGGTLLTQAVAVQQGAGGIQGINPATLRPGQTLLLQGNAASGTMVLQPVVTQPYRAQAATANRAGTLLMPASASGTVVRHALVAGGQIRPGGQMTLSQKQTPVHLIRPPTQPKTVTAVAHGMKHPAPLPPQPAQKTGPHYKAVPPKPGLKISHVQQGIVLSWNMTVTDSHAAIVSYQLFAYQEGLAPPTYGLWKKVGDVKALPLPMACTLTQFQEGNRYHFAVRAVDVHQRVGPFSDPNSIHLVSKSSS